MCVKWKCAIITCGGGNLLFARSVVLRCCWTRHAQTPFPEPSRSTRFFSSYLRYSQLEACGKSFSDLVAETQGSLDDNGVVIAKIQSEIWSNCSVLIKEVKHLNEIYRTIRMDIVIVMEKNNNERNLLFS